MTNFDWTPYGTLPLAVANGLIDGFFVPHDWGVTPPATWPDGKKLVSILTPRGRHLMIAEAGNNYGYPTSGSFARALRQASVMCKTPAGAITLGLARSGPSTMKLGYISGLIAERTMEVKLEGAEEYAAMEQFLSANFPGVTLSSSQAPTGAEQMSIKEMIKAFSVLNPGQKRQIRLVLAVGAVALLGGLLATFGLLWTWVAVMGLAAFVGASLVAMIKIARARNI